VSQRNLLRLHRAGAPVVAATDVPSPWPDAIHHFHGPQMAREVELLGEAGLSPLEAIAAATGTPATMLGLASEVGTLEVGKGADLVLVAGDASRDLQALRRVRWSIRDGVARTPEGWMAE
jgi:imidazolonepropionase-like amidohydrolase